MALQKSLLPVAQDSTQTLPPAAARDLTNTVIQRIQASLDHSVSDNTPKNVRLGLARLPELDPGPGYSRHAGVNFPDRRLLGPPGRGA